MRKAIYSYEGLLLRIWTTTILSSNKLFNAAHNHKVRDIFNIL
jgi:hypothetical protein